MGVHPKVFPDRMHTSVSNLVQHGKFHWEESAKKRKTGQHLNVYLRDCPRAEECPSSGELAFGAQSWTMGESPIHWSISRECSIYRCSCERFIYLVFHPQMSLSVILYLQQFRRRLPKRVGATSFFLLTATCWLFHSSLPSRQALELLPSSCTLLARSPGLARLNLLL